MRRFLNDNLMGLEEIYSNLEDEESRETLIEVLRALLQGDSYRKKVHNQMKKYWECFSRKSDECLVNCGSATGDTIIKYMCNGYDFESIYAFEGDKRQYHILKRNIARLDNKLRKKIHLYNKYIGVDDSNNRFDSLFKNKKVTLINMDIEGAEMGVLRGAKSIIEKYRPVLAVCAYHNLSDLVDIPSFIKEYGKDYLIYLRKYSSAHPGEVSEYVYYCVPKERSLK